MVTDVILLMIILHPQIFILKKKKKSVNGTKKTWKVQVCRVNILTNREEEQTKIKSPGIYCHITLY